MITADPYLEARTRMVQDQISARGITDERVLDALRRVPRERFLPPEQQHAAFTDAAVAIGCGQTISQPFMVASMTSHLDLQTTHRVLEIGTGSGYQTAILACLARQVYTIERIGELQERARTILDELGFSNVLYHVGDGSQGWPGQPPFNRIMVTAAAPHVPTPLTDQLADGGRLVIPVGDQAEQTLTVIERRGHRLIEHPHFVCRFVKLIGEHAWEEPAG